MKDLKIILASGSPRRRELLRGLGLDFEVCPIEGVEEVYPDSLPAEEVAEFLSRLKASAWTSPLPPGTALVTADTIVVNNGMVLGKPRDKEDAARMLRGLSGHSHQVYTGVTIRYGTLTKSFTSCTDVSFAVLKDEEIEYYIENFHPMDKAGAYGIQEWIGYVGVESITGSYFNVMGLPVNRLYRELADLV